MTDCWASLLAICATEHISSKNNVILSIKIFQNAVGAPKVMLTKKLIPNLKNFWSRNGISID